MKLHCSLLVGSSLKNCLQNSFWAVFKRLLTKFLWYLKMVCACSDGFFFQILKSLCFLAISSLNSFVSQGFSAIFLSDWKLFISGAWNSRVVLKTFMKALYILFPSSHWYKLLQSWFERSRLNLFASNFLLFLLTKLCFLFLGSTRKLVVYKTIKWSISTDGEKIWTSLIWFLLENPWSISVTPWLVARIGFAVFDKVRPELLANSSNKVDSLLLK